MKGSRGSDHGRTAGEAGAGRQSRNETGCPLERHTCVEAKPNEPPQTRKRGAVEGTRHTTATGQSCCTELSRATLPHCCCLTVKLFFVAEYLQLADRWDFYYAANEI